MLPMIIILKFLSTLKTNTVYNGIERQQTNHKGSTT
jgi:hypothetical protein